MRIAFMGTPDFAVAALDALADAGHSIAAVYSQPPRPAHRGQAEQPTPVHKRALALGLLVRTPASLRGESEQAAFAAQDLDVAVVAAYGLILPQPILDAPRFGCLNIHASLLPRWRGAAPIQRALEAGDAQTGICIMQMEAGLDTGPVLLDRAIPITPTDTAGTLHDRLAAMGSVAIVEALASLDTLTPQAQPAEGITYAAKIDKAQARLDWHQPAALLERRVRAFNPVPGAFFEVAGERIRVMAAQVLPGTASPGTVIDGQLTIATSDGLFRPELVQRAGKKPMRADDLLRGFPIPAGTVLG
jgi:methionyl-tRNA formyltransferase